MTEAGSPDYTFRYEATISQGYEATIRDML